MGIQKIRVSAQEAQKYNIAVPGNDGFYEATIFTDEHGNIEAEKTYSLAYRNSMMNAQDDRNKAKGGGCCEDCCDDCCELFQDCSCSVCDILSCC